jgi:hypothetical protein
VPSLYRFIDAGVRTAVLDWPEGKLSIFEDNGMEVFDSWQYYVKERMKPDKPTTGELPQILEQLSLLLGEPQEIEPGRKEPVTARKVMVTPVGNATIVVGKAEKPKNVVHREKK